MIEGLRVVASRYSDSPSGVYPLGVPDMIPKAVLKTIAPEPQTRTERLFGIVTTRPGGSEHWPSWPTPLPLTSLAMRTVLTFRDMWEPPSIEGWSWEQVLHHIVNGGCLACPYSCVVCLEPFGRPSRPQRRTCGDRCRKRLERRSTVRRTRR